MDKNDSRNVGQVHRTEDVESGKVVASGEPVVESITITQRKPLCRVPVRRLLGMTAILGALVACAACVWYFLGWIVLIQSSVLVVLAYLVASRWRWFYIALRTLPRDVKALYKYTRLLIQVKYWQKKNVSVSALFQERVRSHPQKHCVLFENEQWTFEQMEAYSNKIANVFASKGYRKGDVVALYMENRPEFIATWVGLSKLGIIVPLINTNQKLSSLLHSVTIANSQAVIFSGELSEAIRDIIPSLDSKVALYQATFTTASTSNEPSFQNLNNLLSHALETPPTLAETVGHHDRLVYIYTSGTTGLPKAAVISNSRYIFIAAAIRWLSGFRISDCFYTPLPLYHTAGGCMSVGQMLLYGSTIVIRKKFSASAYFPECQKYNCTIAQYIGEMCRYVLAVPPQSSDTQHSLRMIYGNGLRPQIWVEFVKRFAIPQVAEFYGATEGNANIVNIDNRVGAVGFVSRIIPSIYPISIIRVDPYTGEPIRNAKGLCMTCKPNEPGVFIGKIIPNNPSRAFLGYVDEAASKKKVVCDVFQKGDKAFLSGDILIADECGYLYFKDRTGDTYRWKGENVSTSEVEALLSNIISYKDVVVYGVEVKGQEGKAGMAAILDPDDNVDLKILSERTKKELPFYARPIFIRILKKMDMTGTYKLRKVELQQEGFNINAIKDNVYYLDNAGNYSPLTTEVYEKINNGTIRV